jgi:hypothetical protein
MERDLTNDVSAKYGLLGSVPDRGGVDWYIIVFAHDCAGVVGSEAC